MLETGGVRVLVDCGMFQGGNADRRNEGDFDFSPDGISAVLLTHAHIDHSGLLPRLAKKGFKGPVYCTEPTLDLLGIMLMDSAHIQEMEAEWANRKRARRGGDYLEALYETEDAIKSIALLKAVRYRERLDLGQGISARFYDAGHILGSSFLELEITENGQNTRLVFSGDLGRPNSLIVDDPATPPMGPVDYLFLESTYGDRDHKNEGKSRDELAEAINYSIKNGQKTIIPAFAVERTQEIIYSLFLLQKEGRIPLDLPVYVDSPLAIRATEIFRRHSGYFDREARELMRNGEDPLSLPGLKFTLKTEESQAINTREGPGVVISASGMCNAGRIKHHLRHNLWRKGASVVFAGFQAAGTPGRKIVDGAKSVTLLGEDIKVAARIFTIGGFSAHAGQSQLLEWAGHFMRPEMKILLVHGEEKAQATLAEKLAQQYGVKVTIPGYLQTLNLEPGGEPSISRDKGLEALAPKSINWNVLLDDSQAKLSRLQAVIDRAGQRGWADQVEIQEQILEINKRLLQLVSNM
jgi:metallo-beta-lactamase family protein